MAKIHDKYIVELAEVIKGYGNDPDTEDPFRLSEFYRFYELPNVAVSRENFDKMKPLSDEREYTEDDILNTFNEGFAYGQESQANATATLYGYNIKDLSLLATVCRKCGVTDEDMKQVVANFEFVCKTVTDRIVRCKDCKRNIDNGGAYPDGRTRCPIQEHYALLQDGFCYLGER